MFQPRSRRAEFWLTALLFLLAAGVGFSGNLSFLGSLERIGSGSISVRLNDRRIVDAMLPTASALGATSIRTQYNMGDQVEITCKPIHPIWEKGTSRYQSLELTAIRLVRHLPAEEVLKESSRAATAPSGDSPELEHARRVNLDYVSHMPNFVADETAKRFRSTVQSPRWRDYDTVEAEITFQGDRAIRRQIRRNHKPWTQPFEALPGFKWYEGFATEIKPLFDAKCPTRIEYVRRSQANGRNLTEYNFSSPVDGCFPFFYFGYERYNPARTGQVFIDSAKGNVFEVDEDANEFPPDFEFAGRQEHVFWDFVKIGDDTHLLPVRANFLVEYHSGTRYRVEVEYKNHRHFESSSNVTFQ